jgi:hypothetical protein
MSGGFGGPSAFGAYNRGDLGTAPIYIIGGVVFLVGLTFIFAFQIVDLGLIISGVGLVLIGVREKPKMNFKWVKYTGPPGLILVIGGLLILLHII